MYVANTFKFVVGCGGGGGGSCDGCGGGCGRVQWIYHFIIMNILFNCNRYLILL